MNICNRLGTELFITLKDEEIPTLETEILRTTVLMVDDIDIDKAKRYERRVELRVGQTPRDELIVWHRDPKEIFTELPATYEITISLEAYRGLKQNGETGWRIGGPEKVIIRTESKIRGGDFW